MIVYGDRDEPAADDRELVARAAALRAMGPGLERHASLVALFLRLAGRTQGVADAAFDHAGCDAPDDGVDACTVVLTQVAGAVVRSWDGACAELPPLPQLDGLPCCARARAPEGHGFYGLYPEGYVAPARRVANALPSPIRVVGLRSIGTGLAAIVAAAIGASPPLTLRPIGHPFARTIRADASLADRAASWIVVDEGPGLSGSSFAAALDWLAAAGVPERRIACLSGHGGALGPQASAANRLRWGRIRRLAADDIMGANVARWAATLLGALDAEPEWIGAGEWRRHLLRSPADWPPATSAWERPKWLLRAGGQTYVARFAGLGAIGEVKLELARSLHAAGFTAEPVGIVHGVLIERWHAEAQIGSRPPADVVRRYLSFRASNLPPTTAGGANAATLLAMTRHNLALAGIDAASLDVWDSRLSDLDRRARPVAIDGRLLAHEWLALPDGRWLKADALDHHAAHDLIGAQDIAWDVAGAAVELGHDPSGLADAMLVAFLTPCYAAFRLGQSVVAAHVAAEPSDGARHRAAAERYAAAARRALAHAPDARPAR